MHVMCGRLSSNHTAQICKPLFAWVAYSLYVTAFMLLVELHEKACIPIVVRSVLSDLDVTQCLYSCV